MSQNEVFHKLVEELLNIVFEYQPFFAVFEGKKDFETKIGNGSKESYENFIEDFLEKVKEIELINPEKLSKSNELEREKIINSAQITKFLHNEFPLWKKDPYGIEDIQSVIFLLLQRDGPTEESLEIIIKQLNHLAKYLNEFRTRFVNETIPKLWVELADKRLETSTQFFDYLVMIFTSERIPESKRNELKLTIDKAQNVVQDHKKWLETLSVDEKEFAWAMGEESFNKYLKLRKLPWNSETILSKGYDLLDSLSKRAKLVAKKIDPTKSYEDVIEEVLSYQPPTFEMVLEFASFEARRAREFLVENELLTLPKNDSLKVIETPVHLVPILPFAAYVPSPFYLPDEPGYFMMTRPLPKEGLRKHSYYSISNTMVHEAFPGHHIDNSCTNQIGSGYEGIAYSLCYHAAETIEGWAHYCEEMMLEEGFHEEIDKVKLVILLDQIWRAVRIIVDIELHTKKRSCEDAIKMLLEHARMELIQATAEVNRYTTAPTYQLSYLLGKLLIQELRKEQEKKLGDSFDLKKFHDTILYSKQLPYYLLKELFES